VANRFLYPCEFCTVPTIKGNVSPMSDAIIHRRPAVFLDRDGTIIEEKHFLSQPDDVVLLPTAGETIARLNSLNVVVVVATNQAGVARGYFPEESIAAVHHRLDELLSRFGATIDRYEYCPHHATEGLGVYRVDCDCRKPRPGMLTRAATALNVDLSQSLMVGDRLGDLQAGASAGCQTSLVRTGYGQSVSLDFDPGALRFLGAFDSLGDAVDAWLPLL
jgi:D-glycero-D-manno-heptose 1,7-bisphosphate phosphatase